MAEYKRATFVLILSCVGALASSVRFAEGVPVIGEGAGPEYAQIHTTLPKTALTAVDTKFGMVLGDEAAAATPGVVPPATRLALASDSVVIGIASFYEGAQETSSGEQYDPEAFTAAAQLEIRDKFGGIRFGKNYQPAYAVGEFGGKKIIVKFNDVGPLKPGRKFDLSRAAMAYFDEGLQVGLLPDFKMTPLPLGQVYQTGPVTDEELVAMGIGYGDDAIVTASVAAKAETAGEAETVMAEIAFAMLPQAETKSIAMPQDVASHSDENEGAVISSLVSLHDQVQRPVLVAADATNLPVVFANKVETDRIAGLRLDGPWFVGNHEHDVARDAESLDRKILAALSGSGLCLVPELHQACGEIAAAVLFIQSDNRSAAVALASDEAGVNRADEKTVAVLPLGRDGENGPNRQRKDGKVEDGAGFHDVSNRTPRI